MPTLMEPPTRRSEYAARFNRVFDHIQTHLNEPLDLAELAHLACFSSFHFHRLFRSWTGETLQKFVQRLRLERAAHQLLYNPRKTITEIALDCGFSGSDTFARSFREHFGRSATDFRKDRKIRQVPRNPGQANAGGGAPSWDPSGTFAAASLEASMTATLPLEVQVQDLPPMQVAYVRHMGPYKGQSELFGRLFGQLCAWAGPRGLLGPHAQLLSLYHDNPDLTPEAKHRVEVALVVPASTTVEGEIGTKALAGGRYAVARIEILPHQYEEAWQSLMAGWLPESGYQPDDRPALELYRNDPNTHPEGRHILDLCLPVRPL